MKLDKFSRNAWLCLYSISDQYPVQPIAWQRQDVETLVRGLAVVFPCASCRGHYRTNLHKYDVKGIGAGRASFRAFVLRLRNTIARAVGKQEYTREETDAFLQSSRCQVTQATWEFLYACAFALEERLKKGEVTPAQAQLAAKWQQAVLALFPNLTRKVRRHLVRQALRRDRSWVQENFQNSRHPFLPHNVHIDRRCMGTLCESLDSIRGRYQEPSGTFACSARGSLDKAQLATRGCSDAATRPLVPVRAPWSTGSFWVLVVLSALLGFGLICVLRRPRSR